MSLDDGKWANVGVNCQNCQFFSGKWLQFSQVGWCLDLSVPRQIHRASQRADRWGLVWRGEPGQILSRRDYAIKKMSKGSTFVWQNAKLIGGLEHCFYFSIYIGNSTPNWRTHIFQRGSNHQPVKLRGAIFVVGWTGNDRVQRTSSTFGRVVAVKPTREERRKLITGLWQWEFQDPKTEVLYHIRPYFVGIFPYIALT